MNKQFELLKNELKNRNESAMAFIFNKYYRDLCFYSNKIIRDFEISRDIVQEVFIKLWDESNKLPDSLEIKSYLYACVKNSSLNYIKKEASKDKYKAKILELLNSHVSNSTEVEYKELVQAVENTINSLPDSMYKIFDLSRNEGLKNREIAEELGISIKTVESNITKALKIFRENLKDYLPEVLLIALFS